jgi:hypothetical protein
MDDKQPSQFSRKAKYLAVLLALVLAALTGRDLTVAVSEAARSLLVIPTE